MARHGLFAKDVYIRLTDGGTGFSYTVKYGWLTSKPRRVLVLEEGEDLLEVEVRSIKTIDQRPSQVQPAAGEEERRPGASEQGAS